MKSMVGTISLGVRAPIVKQGDDLVNIVTNSILAAGNELGLQVADKDVIAITESVVARAQGNYVSVDNIAKEVSQKFGEAKIGVIFPILSRNRFSMIFKGICRGAKNGVVLMLGIPSDEVGNHLISEKEWLLSKCYNKELITEEMYRECFGYQKHEFTGVDYIEYYKEIAKAENCSIEVIFSNNPNSILYYTHDVLCCDIHTRSITKNILKEKLNYGVVYGLDELCTEPVGESGYNKEFGLLGSNKANEEKLKLFPRDCEKLCEAIQDELCRITGKKVEVMVYGDGAFKDPKGKIWELADPVVSPGHTKGILLGKPNEIKLKAMADGKYESLRGNELKDALIKEIINKNENLVGDMSSQGTTPRQFTDLLGSLADLTSGSGDKGTPIVWIKNYFRNYADN